MYYPMPPTAAYSDCKIGIWAKLTTRKIDNQDIVMDYTIKIYNQGASFKDMRKRKAAIPPPIPDNAHRPVL